MKFQKNLDEQIKIKYIQNQEIKIYESCLRNEKKKEETHSPTTNSDLRLPWLAAARPPREGGGEEKKKKGRKIERVRNREEVGSLAFRVLPWRNLLQEEDEEDEFSLNSFKIHTLIILQVCHPLFIHVSNPLKQEELGPQISPPMHTYSLH